MIVRVTERRIFRNDWLARSKKTITKLVAVRINRNILLVLYIFGLSRTLDVEDETTRTNFERRSKRRVRVGKSHWEDKRHCSRWRGMGLFFFLKLNFGFLKQQLERKTEYFQIRIFSEFIGHVGDVCFFFFYFYTRPVFITCICDAIFFTTFIEWFYIRIDEFWEN